MFDWDRDYDSFLEDQHPVGLAAVADLMPEPAPALWRRVAGRLGRWALTGAVVLGLGAGGLAAVLPKEDSARLAAAVAAWSMQMLGQGASMLPEEMPAGLIAYAQPQYDNFRYGIAGFSDADLLQYVRNAERDLAHGTPIADFTRDTLDLARREAGRRGLQRPMTSLRDAFGPR